MSRRRARHEESATWAHQLVAAHVCISSGHIPANTMRGLFGSIAMSEQPKFSSVKRTRSQFFPPSVVRTRPALLLWAIGMTERARQHVVGILRIDCQVPDASGFLETHQLPGLARVS